MGKLITAAVALLLALTLAGCSSGGGGGGNTGGGGNKITGQLRVTSATPLSKRLTHPVAADIGGLTSAGAGVEVDLVRLDNQGLNPTVLASTLTDASGTFTFSGTTIPAPSSTLAVQVPGQSTTMRAFASGTVANISPATETVFQAVTAATGVNLTNLTLQELTALSNVASGMGIDVSGKTFADAVTAIQAAAGSTLSNLITAYSSSSPSTDLQNNPYNTVSTTSTLNAAPSIDLATGFGSSFIDNTNTTPNGSFEAIIAPISHNLIAVSQGAAGGSADLSGWVFLHNPNGQLVVSDSSGNGVLGAITANASLMAYPLAGNTPAGAPYTALARGMRIVTRSWKPVGDSIPSFNNTVLDTTAGAPGTTYHLVQLSQTLSSKTGSEAATVSNAVTASATTGDLLFNSTTALTTIDGVGPYASFTANNTLNADNLALDFDTDVISGSHYNNTSLGTNGVYYSVNPFGTLTVRDNDNASNAFLGLGSVAPGGEIFTLAQTPNDDGQQAALAGTGTHSMAVAIRHTSTPVTLTPGTYNVVSYAYYLGGAPSPFTNPTAVAVDSANNRMLVVDNGPIKKAVVAVDLTSNVYTTLSDNTTPDTTNPFTTPIAVAVDSANHRALVVDQGLKAVMAVDLTAGLTLGARTILSGSTIPDGINAFINPVAIVLDSVNNRALVVDVGLQAVVAVDLTAGPTLGTRTILSDISHPDATNPFVNPVAITVNSAGTQALVVDSRTVVAVDVDPLSATPGVRTILSDNFNHPDATNSFINPVAITLDSTNNRALVVDNQAVVAVSLADGTRTILSDISHPDATNSFINPLAIALDSTGTQALVADSGLGKVVAVSLTDGERTIVPLVSSAPAAIVASEYSYGTLTLDSDGTTVSGGSLFSNRASLDAVAKTLSASPAPVTLAPGTITTESNDNIAAINLPVGTNTITGSGAVTASGEVIALATKIKDTASSTDIGRGLLFLIRQP